MKLKQFVLLAVVLLMLVNVPVSADETLAKGCLYAWSAVMLADGSTNNTELGMFNMFAKANNATKEFYSDKFVAKGFEEAIITWKKEGMDALVKKIPPLLKGATGDDRRIILYNFYMLADADNDFTSKEMGVIKSIIDEVNYSRDDVLYAGMIYASNK